MLETVNIRMPDTFEAIYLTTTTNEVRIATKVHRKTKPVFWIVQ